MMTNAKSTQKKKRWSWSTGERGRNRVRVFEHHATGLLYVEYYEASGTAKRPTPKRIALGHRDREAAKTKAEELAAAFRKAERVAPAAKDPTLFDIVELYLQEVTPTKATSTQRHDRATAELFYRAFGRLRAVKTLNVRDWNAYIRDRRCGELRPKTKEWKGAVGNRIIEQDLRLLLAVLNWAVRARDARGERLLEQNPLSGLPVPKEESPRRVLLSEEEYCALRRVAPDVGAQFALALVLAHETGHRLNSIRQLRWSDFDTAAGTVRWRAEADKIGFEHTTLLTEELKAAVERARRQRAAIGDGWLFPSADDPAEPTMRHRFLKWWHDAESKAELKPVRGRGWHSLRRKFATELKDMPLKDLCALGGWKEATTILTCYMQADEVTMRRALEARAARREAAAP